MGTIAAVETMEWKKYITGQHMAEGFCMPWGWGISRYCMMSDRRQIHPIPLNYIISFGWWLYIKMGKPWFVEAAYKEQVKHAKYSSQWWRDGWKAGWADCKAQEDKKIKDNWKRWEEIYKEDHCKSLADHIARETINRLVE